MIYFRGRRSATPKINIIYKMVIEALYRGYLRVEFYNKGKFHSYSWLRIAGLKKASIIDTLLVLPKQDAIDEIKLLL